MLPCAPGTVVVVVVGVTKKIAPVDPLAAEVRNVALIVGAMVGVFTESLSAAKNCVEISVIGVVPPHVYCVKVPPDPNVSVAVGAIVAEMEKFAVAHEVAVTPDGQAADAATGVNTAKAGNAAIANAAANMPSLLIMEESPKTLVFSRVQRHADSPVFKPWPASRNTKDDRNQQEWAAPFTTKLTERGLTLAD